MQYIINYITSLWSLIKTVVGYFITMIQSILLIFDLLPEYIGYFISSVNVLPAFLFAFAFLMFSVIIITAITKWMKG